MTYVDGFLLPVHKKKLAAYRRLAQKAAKIWREHGALQYVETAAADLGVKVGLPFPRTVKPKTNETIVFSWILYKSRAHRDRVTAKVMNDPRLPSLCKTMPFDVKRMNYGGFKVLVKA